MSPASAGARHPLVAVYADESCLGNGREGQNPGGAGVLIEYARATGEPLVRQDLWVSEPATTNNRMALRSATEAFNALSARGAHLSVVFTSDSKYLIEGMKSWVRSWVKRDWKKADGKPVENRALWEAALGAIGAREVDWRWVCGHAGHPQNEYANHLATRAAREQSTSHALVESSFDTWLVSQRTRGAIARAESAFPDATTFRAARPTGFAPVARV